MYQRTDLFRLGTVALLTLCAQPLFGGVVLDGSFGTSGPLPGPNFMIQANFGRQVGSNLFHSFSQFNLISSQSATFTGPSNVHNILARVTSGSPSSIDGRIQSDIQGANLFFMNPAGVLFGRHAQLDVSGSVAVTTANYLKLVGGGRFNANLGGGDVLTSAPVSAFGFLNSAPAPVSIANATLSVAPGKSCSVVAGDIALDGTQLSAPGGNVSLFSARASGEVVYDPSDPGAHFRDSNLTAFGNITLKGAAMVAIDSPLGGGKVTMRGGHLAVTDSSTISSINQGANVGGDIELTADTLSVVKGGIIEAEATSDGAGGNLSIQSTNITVDGDDGSRYSAIGSRAESGMGDAGNLVLNTTNLTISNGAAISGSSFSEGRGADVTITASTIDIFGFTTAFGLPGIFANAYGAGNGGNITVRADALLSINSSGGIGADTSSSGHGGDVTIKVNGALTITGGSVISTDTFSLGKAGDVSIDAGSLNIDGSGLPPGFPPGILTGIETNSIGAGDAGAIKVRVNGAIAMLNDGVILGNAFSSGKGGDITIQAPSLTIDGSAANGFLTGIETSSIGAGDAGAIKIRVNGAIAMLNDGVILAGAYSSGKGGDVAIQAASLTIDGSSAHGFTGIDVATVGTGDAGSVSLKVNGALEITGGPTINGTGIGADTGSSGKGGDLTISASSIVINHDGVIVADSFSSGDGGSVTVRAGSMTIDGSSERLGTGISSDAYDQGNAGDVHVSVTGLLKIIGGGTIESSTSDAFETGNNFGNAGDVTVKAGSIVIDGAGKNLTPTGIFAQSGFAELGETSFGNGGNIEVSANDLLLLNGGEVSASSVTSGAAGSVQLDLGRLRLDSNSSVSSQNSGTGIGGSVLIDVTGAVELSHHSSISTFSAAADAGSIDLRTNGPVHLSDHSSITASAGINGGNIHITAPELVYLLNSEITAAAGINGGSIMIDPAFIVLNNSLISANAAQGRGGNIDLISDFFFSSNSPITATGTTNGTINISAPELDLGAELITLPVSLLSAESQLQERCTALLRGDFSSFISIGRGGTEPAPEELQTTF